jgi:methylated-DNA-[protein]-cysteine S-methyltransferase
MKPLHTLSLHSPVGALTLFAEDEALVALDWGEGMDAPKHSSSATLTLAAQKLRDYFKTGRIDLSGLKLAPSGTAFQKRVWREMQKIKPGHTKTYGEIATALNSGPRAVGGACAANPIAIFIPCHRVIGANGRLGNYSGGDGPETKQFLLRLEGLT